MKSNLRNALKAASRIKRAKTKAAKRRAIHAWADEARKMLGA